jgi:two-component system response regulator MprA
MRVLLVEDERKMANALKRGLEEENHRVTVALEGREGFELAARHDFDIVILDVMLPVMDGFEVARKLRQSKPDVPILMLTARDATPDVIHGLDLGADDYLTKPFAFDELLARIRAVARRRPSARAGELRVDDLVLDPSKHRVTRAGIEIKLSATEFRLLEFLMRRGGQVVPRAALIEGVWEIGSDLEENTLDAFIRLLRNKIDREHETKLIHTVRGVGYSLRAGNAE